MTALYFGVGELELPCEVGDSVDVLFNIDINDFRNIKSIQLILQDLRIDDNVRRELERQKIRYEEIKNGGAYSIEECVLPDRDDFARVYVALRKEFRQDNSILDTKSILKLVNTGSESVINYIKFKFIVRILDELQICSICEIDKDIYSFDISFNSNKTNIEKSSILKKLKGQCTDARGRCN